MRQNVLVLAGLVAAAAAGCGPSERIEKLQAALAQAKISLADSVDVAEASVDGGVGLKAALLVDGDPVYSVRARGVPEAQRVHVDIVSGGVLERMAAAPPAWSCDGAISLAEAIRVAEAEVGGQAVSIEPDDDGGCQREVQVLEGDTLWEVEVDAAGRVTETEESDEEDGEDDD